MHDVGGKPRVMVQDAATPVYARLAAAFAKFSGSFVEIHTLDARTAKRAPQDAMGRVLDQDEARELLDRIA